MWQTRELAGNTDGQGGAIWQAPLTLRFADLADRDALQRLAQLDSRSLPPGPHLLAEREGGIDAALSLLSGELVADPFRRTAELGDLLRRHAAAMLAVHTTSGGSPVRPRPVTVTA
jgi:hypothetical protein